MFQDRPPFDAPLSAYQDQASALLRAHGAGEPTALEFVRRHDPRFRDARVAWLARPVPAAEVAATPFDAHDARRTIACSHDFADWAALEEWVAAVGRGGGVERFEAAVEALVGGDLQGLAARLRADPELVRARSTRRTPFDPPVHRATLLHYLAANGVEGARQRTPANAPAMADALFAAGAEAAALADFYGQECETLSLLVSSSHPAQAGVQGALVERLLDHGAALEGRGESWGTPLLTALVFGCLDAADALVRRGARVDDLVTAAGLGRVDEIERRLPDAGAQERHRALALAAQLGRVGTLKRLLDAGEDPDRHNPEGVHPHATPLHQAVWGGHRAVVELLVQRGARLDIRDRIYAGTPREWARHAGREEIEALLARAGG